MATRGRPRSENSSHTSVAPVNRPVFGSSNHLDKRYLVSGNTGEARFIDDAITMGVAGVSVLWTASRGNITSELGYATFFTVLGGLMAVQGTGELRYGGFGLMSANFAYILLRLFHTNLSP